MSATSGKDPILHGLLQSDLDANNFAITNLDLTGSGIGVAPTIQHTSGVLKGDGSGNAVVATAKTDFWDGTVFPGNDTGHGVGLVPDPGAGTGTANFLCEDGSWAVPPGTALTPTISHVSGVLKGDSSGNAVAATAKTDFWDTTIAVASGASHAKGLVPDPGVTGGTTKFLREDMTYAVPPASAGVVIANTTLVIKGDNAGGGVAATPGTLTGDYVAPSTAFGRLLAATTAITSTANAYTINWNTTTSWTHTLTENVTYAFSNSTDTWSIVVTILNNSSNYTVTWPSGIKWLGGTAPTMTLGAKYDIYGFIKQGSVIQGIASQNHS